LLQDRGQSATENALFFLKIGDDYSNFCHAAPNAQQAIMSLKKKPNISPTIVIPGNQPLLLQTSHRRIG
jgi:hypothetical protein